MSKTVNVTVYRDLGSLKKMPNNPRVIKNDQFKKLCDSIKNNPDYFEARPIILSDRTGELVIIAGNQRFEAAKHLKLQDVPTTILKNLTEEREKEIVIRDNVNNGEWDYDLLGNDFELINLDEWGVNIQVGGIEDDNLNSNENSDRLDKSQLQQMKFVLTDEQVSCINNAIDYTKKTDEYKYCETFGNENSNSNALYFIVSQWHSKTAK